MTNTHRYELIVKLASGKRVRAKGKVSVPAGKPDNAIAIADITRWLDKAEQPFTAEGSAKFFKLPIPKVGAKLNTQHDYLTLRATFADGTTLNLTTSRNGTKTSGSALDNPLSRPLNRALFDYKGVVGTGMNVLLRLANEHVNSFDAFANAAINELNGTVAA